MKLFSILAAAVALTIASTACSRSSSDSDNKQAALVGNRAKIPAKTAPTSDSRTQYDLAAAIRKAEIMNLDERALTLKQIRNSWRGKRYRWTVYRIAPTCPSSARCNVLAFDLGGADRRKIVQGWMPRIELTDESFAALTEKCGDAPRCQFEFEGTLSQFTLSTEDLTSLHFKDVHIL